MPKRKTPVTFDEWLGKVIDDETGPSGGRPAVAQWVGISEQSVNRRARGDVPYLVREVEVIAHRLGIETHELVDRALARFGGIEKLVAESVSDAERNVTVEDNVTYLGRVTPPLSAAADEKPRVDPKD